MRPIIALLSLMVFAVQATPEWQPLLDKNLSHWDTYLSYRHSEDYNGSVPLDKHGRPLAPIGLNQGNEEHQVFTMLQQGDELVLRISGEIYGALTSKQDYRNYHLSLWVRWGEIKWPPRQNKLMDSGILYHGIGEHGQEYFRSWLLSQEFQIMQGHMGDYWKQATSAIDIRAYQPEYIMNPVADEHQPFIKVGEGEKIQGFVLRKENHEYPHGEWNHLELICYEGQSLHIVNGNVVMVLKNSRYILNGEPKPLVEGKIQLQSEAAEVFFKRIKIKPVTQLENRYQRYFNAD